VPHEGAADIAGATPRIRRRTQASRAWCTSTLLRRALLRRTPQGPRRHSQPEGAPLKALDGNEIRFAILAVDVAVLTILATRLHVLLIPIHLPPQIVHARGLPGGLVHPRETAEDAVVRLLEEKAGLGRYYSEQLATFSGIERDPRGRVVSVAYLALVPGALAGARALPQGAAWCPVADAGRLAYDHAAILEAARERLRGKLVSTTIARELLAQRFTLSELQNVYETVLGRALDKRNFRKKLIGGGIVKPTGRLVRQPVGRPGQLYRFAGSRPETIGMLAAR
jgi:8-oxo-dGTP diphosphatase